MPAHAAHTCSFRSRRVFSMLRCHVVLSVFLCVNYTHKHKTGFRSLAVTQLIIHTNAHTQAHVYTYVPAFMFVCCVCVCVFHSGYRRQRTGNSSRDTIERVRWSIRNICIEIHVRPMWLVRWEICMFSMCVRLAAFHYALNANSDAPEFMLWRKVIKTFNWEVQRFRCNL